MQPHTWTELFFLDEAAALSAGHRPCAECRNADYKRFRRLWETSFGAPAGADAMDRTLHAERLAGREKRTYHADVATLPEGTYVAVNGTAWVLWGNEILAWSSAAYGERRPRPARGEVEVLTPPSIVAVLRAGYGAGIHPSA